jgi:hypothetical protein
MVAAVPNDTYTLDLGKRKRIGNGMLFLSVGH